MERWILGIDCAVKPERSGVAIGVLSGEKVRLLCVGCCSEKYSVSAVAARFSEKRKDVLFALDAPLGWPAALGAELRDHRAGGPLGTAADLLFRRRTDRFIKCQIGKQPLDVGADRIARTAESALRTLREIGERLGGVHIPLAWSPTESGFRAIEVYPAATLAVCRDDAKSNPYKNKDQRAARKEILDCIPERMIIKEKLKEKLQGNADLLDAALCVLAGADFLLGESMPPEIAHLATAKKEGWIWVREPKQLKECSGV